MSSTTIQVTNSATMGIYELPKAISMWRDTSKAIIASGAGASSSTQAESEHENKVKVVDNFHCRIQATLFQVILKAFSLLSVPSLTMSMVLLR